MGRWLYFLNSMNIPPHKTTKTLFYQTLSLFTKTLIIFQIISLTVIIYYLLIPLLQRATNDLAAVMIENADKWQHLGTTQQQQLAATLKKRYDVHITSAPVKESTSTPWLPFIYFLSRAIEQNSNYQVAIHESYDAQHELYIWVDLITTAQTIHFGFSKSRIGVNKLNIFIIMMCSSIILILITTFLLTRRLTAPLSHLSKAAQSIAKGQFPQPVPEQGSEELSSLAKQFNTMNTRIQELLANRTTLLAGISHDLRTPLTQIRLALSLLPNKGGNEALMQSIKHDLDDINDLINEVLDIGLTLSEGKAEPTNINTEIKHIINTLELKSTPISIDYLADNEASITTYPLAFRRIIKNLLNNAILYGQQHPVHIQCQRNATHIHISIIDQGPGIPNDELEHVFQPFYRLEKSRNSDTGGSGLGLALVRQLAETHQWHVTLNTPKTGGLCAILIIPVH